VGGGGGGYRAEAELIVLLILCTRCDHHIIIVITSSLTSLPSQYSRQGYSLLTILFGVTAFILVSAFVAIAINVHLLVIH